MIMFLLFEYQFIYAECKISIRHDASERGSPWNVFHEQQRIVRRSWRYTVSAYPSVVSERETDELAAHMAYLEQLDTPEYASVLEEWERRKWHAMLHEAAAKAVPITSALTLIFAMLVAVALGYGSNLAERFIWFVLVAASLEATAAAVQFWTRPRKSTR